MVNSRNHLKVLLLIVFTQVIQLANTSHVLAHDELRQPQLPKEEKKNTSQFAVLRVIGDAHHTAITDVKDEIGTHYGFDSSDVRVNLNNAYQFSKLRWAPHLISVPFHLFSVAPFYHEVPILGFTLLAIGGTLNALAIGWNHQLAMSRLINKGKVEIELAKDNLGTSWPKFLDTARGSKQEQLQKHLGVKGKVSLPRRLADLAHGEAEFVARYPKSMLRQIRKGVKARIEPFVRRWDKRW